MAAWVEEPLRARTLPWGEEPFDCPCKLLVRCRLFPLPWLELLELTEVDESEASPLA